MNTPFKISIQELILNPVIIVFEPPATSLFWLPGGKRNIRPCSLSFSSLVGLHSPLREQRNVAAKCYGMFSISASNRVCPTVSSGHATAEEINNVLKLAIKLLKAEGGGRHYWSNINLGVWFSVTKSASFSLCPCGCCPLSAVSAILVVFWAASHTTPQGSTNYRGRETGAKRRAGERETVDQKSSVDGDVSHSVHMVQWISGWIGIDFVSTFLDKT